MICLCSFRVESEFELTAPVELVPRLRERIVPVPRAGEASRDVRRMRRDSICRKAITNVVFVRQTQVLFGRNASVLG